MKKILELGNDYVVFGNEELDCVFAEQVERNHKRAKAERKKLEVNGNGNKVRVVVKRRKNKWYDAAAFVAYIGAMFLMLAAGVVFGLNIGGL